MKQKTTLTRSRWLFACLLSLLMTLGGSSPAWADELTIANGGNTNNYVPLYGSYADTNGAVSEFIVPAASLASINGKDINKLTFYTSTPSDKKFTATFKVYLKEIAETVYDDATAYGSTDASTVYTGTLDATGATMVIEFSSNYKYNGGNLLVGIQVTSSGNWSSALVFSGETQSEYTGFSSKASTKRQNFIPKTTFTTQTEGPGFAVKDGSTTISSPYAYNFGLTTAGTTKTFKLTNPGTEATPISVNASGANGFTAAVEDNATSIPAGGEKTLTITMPDATASGSIVVTPTGDGLSAFTFNVSGTVLDANKIYVDFTNANPKPEDWTLDTGWSVNGGGYATIGSTEASIRTSKIVSSGEDLIIKYRGNNSYWSSWGASYYPSIKVYYATNGNGGGADWTQCGSTITGEAIGYNEWKTTTYNIPSTAKYIAITGKYIDVDFIYGCSEPLNPTPQNLAYSNVTNASAQLSWTSTAANFNIQYKTTSAGEWTTIENVTANPYILTGLAAETEYQVKVQADHGVNGLSDYTDPVSFTTKPNPISVYPYTENFNSLSSGQIPAFWDNSEGTTTSETYKWVYYATGHDGACVRFNSSNNYSGRTNFLKTRPFSWVQGQNMKLSFWYKNPSGGDFTVYVSNDGGTTKTELASGLTAQTDWIQKEYNIDGNTIYGDNVVFIFKGTSNYGNSSAYIWLDDVTISEVSAYSMSVSGGDVSENTIAFGTVKNTTTTKTFTINNDGSGDLTGVSVVSSDDAKFTVSDTGFDIAAGATKDITVTFVKEEEANYSETITISQANVATPIVLTATATYQAPTPATVAVKLNDVAVGASVPFGTVGKAKTKTFTIANTGEATLNITSIVSSNTTDFTVSPASLDVAGGETGEFTVTFVWDGEALNAEKTANITVTPSNAGLDPIVFAVTGTRENMWTEDFSANSLPDGWEDAAGAWTFAGDGVAVGSYNNGKFLFTPSLLVEEGKSMTFEAKKTGGYVDLIVYYSKNNGDYVKYTGLADLTTEYQTYTISGLDAGIYKFRINDEAVYLKNFEGFKLNLNDPTIAVYSDSEATQEVATETTKDFGWVADDADAAAFTSTYYIKNNGTGTLTISNISAVEGFTAATAGDVMTVAAGADPLALTITMNKNAVGAKSGTFTLTTDGGNFTIPVKGFVYGNRNLIDFSSAAQTAGWNKGTWTIDENVASVAAASTMQTTSFVVNANEKLYVEAKRTADNYHTGSLSYSYSINNGESWTDGEAALFSATGSSDYDTYTISDIAGNEERTVLIRFNGAYAAINRIYGFEAIHVAEMVVSQTEAIAFGMQTEETTETSFTISNANGSKTLEGLSVTLGKTGEDAEYEVRMEKNDAAFTGTEIAVGEVVTVYVKQLFDINKLGAKSDVLTIAATDQTPVAINLSGATRDASKLYVDFDGSNDWPAAIASHGANWEVYAGYARQNSATASSLVLAPLTISQASEALRFKASRVDTNRDLTVRYTTNGGVTWNDYNFGTNETPVTSLKEQITSTSSYNDFEITNIPAGTVAFDFYGKSIKMDNITADYSLANAPLVAFTKVTDNISDANLTADAVATYTLANNGNANYVGTVAKSNVNVAIIGEGVTYEGSTLTIPAGKTAEITVTMPFTAPYGAKNGSMTITSESWVGDVAVNYTANLIDPDAINVDFASAPAGWYNAGWTVNGTANIYSGVEKELISEQFAAEEGKNVLSFKAKAQSGNEGTLKVYTSTDRKTWSEPTEFDLTNEYATKNLAALDNGECYYVKFVSLNANIDDLTGLKKVTGIEHDLYVSASNIPTETKVPGTEITATATVYSLRADETGVYAKLFFDETVVATAAAQDISLNGSKTFELTGNVPATEKTYAAKIVVYYSDNSVAFETLTTNVEVQHTRTLNIATFTRTDGDGALDADVNNQVSPAFSVTVQNTGTTAGTPTVKIYQGENVVATATAAAEVAAGATSDAIALTATNMSAGEGGDMAFTAKAFWTAEDLEAKATSASDIVITINAAAPKFALYDSEDAPVANETAYDYGLTRTKIDKVFTIKNEGTKTLELTSIVAPTGFTATAVTNENKDIAVNGELEITISLDPTEGLGKKNGNVVITYNVNGTPATFTLAVSGRSIAENTWVEQFDTEIPATWQKTGWTWNEDRKTAYSGGVEGTFTLMTPRLAAANAEVLTYETKWQFSGDNMTVQYSTDKTNWTDYETVTASTETVEHQFVAPAAGNYYLKFTASRYVNLDNFIGFVESPLEHDVEITASNVPTTGTQYGDYVATVTLKENVGKDENFTAELWVNDAKVNATADVAFVGKNSTQVVTLTWEPQDVINAAVQAYVKVTYAGGELQTVPVNLTVAAPYTLNEESTDDITFGEYQAVVVERSFAKDWNTICLPFGTTTAQLTEQLGVTVKAYALSSYNGNLNFTEVTELAKGNPYLIHVALDANTTGTVDLKFKSVNIESAFANSPNTVAGKFVGTYKPVAASGLEGKYGVTPTNKIAKGNAKTTMKGFRAYFEGISVNARISIYDEATGITKVYAPADLFGDHDRVYNLSGQKVENAKKGVYIVNGRKVVVK